MGLDMFSAHRRLGAGPAAATAAGCVLTAGLALTGCGSSASSAGSTTAATSSSTTAAASASAAATATATASSAAAGGGSTSSVPFPVAVGNTWTYKITTGAETGTTIDKMTAVVPVAGGQQVTMSTTDSLLGTTKTNQSTYVFHSDGSIVYPLSQIEAGSGITVSGSGIVWPPASVIDSGQPSKSELQLSINADGQKISTTAHITVQGTGTQTVTVPAGTYQATVVTMTEAVSIDGITATIQVRNWLAPGVGPVKDEVLTDEGGTSAVTATEELQSFTKA